MKVKICQFLFKENFLKMAYFVNAMPLDNMWNFTIWQSISPEIQALIVPKTWRVVILNVSHGKEKKREDLL